MDKRIAWVDVGKFVCIMCVMLSHLESITKVLFLLFEPFYLTLFFFLSGYVYRQPNSFREHLKKKVLSLLVPWFLFSNFNILLSAVITLKGERNFLAELCWNLLQIRGMGDGVWFVAALFMAFLPFYFVIRWNRPVVAILISSGLYVLSVLYSQLMNPAWLPWGTVALPWHLEYIFKAMLWMVLGYYFKVYGEKIFDRYQTGITWMILLGIYLLVVYLPFFNGGYIFLPVFKRMIGIATTISISKKVRMNRYIAFVGANTLTYFALHGKVYAVLELVLRRFLGEFYEIWLGNACLSSFLAVAITIVISLLLIIPAEIINRYFPWVLGRHHRRRTK